MNTPEISTVRDSGADNATSEQGYTIGDLIQVTCETPAHGGALVARTHAGVVFVRHGVVGEEAQVRITAIGPKNRFYFADVVAVKVPALGAGRCPQNPRRTSETHRHSRASWWDGIWTPRTL